MDRRYLLVAALLATVDAGAATFNKCVDESGHVTFTQAACPGGLAGESITVHRGGAGMSLGPAPTPVVTEQAAPEAEASGQVNVVGGGSACDGGSEQDIRTAIVRKQVYAGMTDKQARQAWGAPNKINRSSSGDDQWVYYRGNVDMQFIYVDQNGCVTGWN
ncbi:DUF4124 domain-containing protein [Ectopseudomonas oleovorans]|jgi:hypothetical protein|uniref:DUF4124 domain-containing protein n=1 Tax=Ectopseudomonas oleovorans TaxID=301 RepID=A0A3R9CRD6_ECTOL|nr:DUF4124 domain-containing protein [Pseudomonas oleovorans]RRW34791.1 DUF4124 domain-containing protein [Pseudomonas oleovorans]